MVGLTGLEPVTPRLSSVCSNQLSYRSISFVLHNYTMFYGFLQPKSCFFKFAISVAIIEYYKKRFKVKYFKHIIYIYFSKKHL